MTPTLGFIFICKDETEKIDQMLESIKPVGFDAVLCGWNGEKPETEAVLKKHGVEIHRWKWNDNFAEARQFVHEKCPTDYIMWLDSDDILINASMVRPIFKKALKKGRDAIFFPYQYRFDDGHCCCLITRERIVKKSNSVWRGRMDDCLWKIEKDWKHFFTDQIWVKHNADFEKVDKAKLERNLRMGKIAYDNKESVGSIFYYARSLYDIGRVAEAVDVWEEFLCQKDLQLAYRYYASIMLVHAFILLDRYDDAERYCDLAAGYLPTCGEPVFKKAYIKSLRGDWDAVIALCNQGWPMERPVNMQTQIDPLNWTLRPAMIYAQALAIKGRLRESFNVIQHTLKSFPTNAFLLNLREEVVKKLAIGAINARNPADLVKARN